MSPNGIDDVSRVLGQLEATVTGLVETVRTLTSSWQTQDDAATVARRRLHDKVEEFGRQLTTAVADIKALAKRLDDVEPSVQQFERQRDHAAGAVHAFRLVWVGLTTLLGGLGGALVTWLIQYFDKPHH